MPTRRKLGLTGTIVAVALVSSYGVLFWQAEPDLGKAEIIEPPSTNDPEGDDGGGSGDTFAPPEVSIVFVIDSSQTMFPRIGPNYFELARDAILNLLDLPGFKEDGRVEIGVVQFPSRSAPGYTEDIHWIRPSHIGYSSTLYEVYAKVAGLERSLHYTAGMMETGIKSARNLLLNRPHRRSSTDEHIILLTTGEYALPAINLDGDSGDLADTCPPLAYSLATSTCDACNTSYATECNRACQIREQVAAARDNGITVSAVQLGYDWHGIRGSCYGTEGATPYGDPAVYCEPSGPPEFPDRGGFLQEITRSTCDTDSGRYVRINPILCPDCEANGEQPGSPQIVMRAIANWLCEWGYTGDGDADNVITLCDNCPSSTNPYQRDCDRDGIGDACQQSASWCVTDINDTDGDGVCNGRDTCPGGDDCLVAEWLERKKCTATGACDCDCDNNGESDLCQAAQELFDETLGTNGFAAHDVDFSGIPDECEPSQCCSQDCESGDTLCADCSGIPAACNVAGMAGEMYEEPFDDGNPDTPEFGPLLETDTPWLIAGPVSTEDRVRIVPGEGQYYDNQDLYGTRDYEGQPVLELQLDPEQPTDGSAGWYVESPGMVLPALDLAKNTCDSFVPGAWGVVAIEVDLKIDNHLGGPVYDLYVLDTCAEGAKQTSPGDAARIHLQFRGDFVPATGEIPTGSIWIETAVPYAQVSPPYDPPFQYLGHFRQDAWFRLAIFINTAVDYVTLDERPIWNGGGHPVTLYYGGEESDWGIQYGDLGYPELGLTWPFEQRDVKLRFSTSNRACDCVTLGEDKIMHDKWAQRAACPTYEAKKASATRQGCVEAAGGQAAYDAWIATYCAVNSGSNPDPWFNGIDDATRLCRIADCMDNCPFDQNSWQADSDYDGVGDTCDINTKQDGDLEEGDDLPAKPDGVLLQFDNCAQTYNPLVPFDASNSLYSDAKDKWGLEDGVMWQPDRDLDGVGDACDHCPDHYDPANPLPGTSCDDVGSNSWTWEELDPDADGTTNETDRCPYVSLDASTSADNDGDGIPNTCDNCQDYYNPDQFNRNYTANQRGDVCDSDSGGCVKSGDDCDGDGIPDANDNCVSVCNPVLADEPSQRDADRDGIGDACDTNTHLTDCDADGEIDQQEDEQDFCNPCLQKNCLNPGKCMCLSPGYVFQRPRPGDAEAFPELVAARRDAARALRDLYTEACADLGVSHYEHSCPIGRCSPNEGCGDRIQIGFVRVRPSNWCEWQDKSVCPDCSSVKSGCTCDDGNWTCSGCP